MIISKEEFKEMNNKRSLDDLEKVFNALETYGYVEVSDPDEEEVVESKAWSLRDVFGG